MVYSGPRGESRVQGTVMLNMGRYYVHFDVEAVRVRLDKKPPFDIPNFKKLQFERGTNSKGAYIIISDAGTPHDWKDKWANM